MDGASVIPVKEHSLISYSSNDDAAEMFRQFRYKYALGVTSDTKLSISSFEITRTLGEGAFGRVVLAMRKVDGAKNMIALKILKKKTMVESQQVNNVKAEKKILSAIDHPFIIKFIISFQDNSNLYLGLEYLPYGDLFCELHRCRCFDEDNSKFLASQVFMALEYLHANSIIYRDIKPENIMLTKQGYLKLCDFGLAKYVVGTTYTMCGTPQYVAPEMLMNKRYGKSVDWWSFGILVFEMCSGDLPFADKDQDKMFSSIVTAKPIMPKSFSPKLIRFITEILNKNENFRLGCKLEGPVEIKNHSWFEHVNFKSIYNRTVVSFLKPKRTYDAGYKDAKPSRPSLESYRPSLFADF